ncbi:hypothetical protein AA0119_g9230 [Alternaria tenuissima]|jgi:hypothetical protein|uniref:Uncharacterized protein n=1 Tax=Alternaria tenuissima TaxID=119927 RepID=A0ABY0G0F4_9PLEO|nr:hypothetical protein AALT_g2769 [Alternaria alternata]RYN94291.1 hypothetical protein AA0119_g9230 [Alternaria tenuissima]RYO11263.1 hypothetical protein AA0121_g10097 [Alternaria tenuissima]
MASLPAIDVVITASPAVFDIDGSTELSIWLNLTLRHDRPITLYKRETSLFNGKILHAQGLTFNDTKTGQHVPRNTIDICTFQSEGGISWATRCNYITLYPGQTHVIETRIVPWNADGREKTSSTNDTSYLRWIRFAGFKDGHTYRIGIANDAVVDQWLEGSIWGILGWQKLGSAPATVRANVRFTLDKTSTFTIKRADADEPPEDLVAMVRTLH